ncbi:MAG: Uma2 family endonuclease [Planctomycetes bacterium]|nr:Uma2 family endonuclease [Planctomycetota bacterium]
MKAVIVDVPDSLFAERHRLGLDRRDEVWEGVVHMVPPPTWEHQRIVDSLQFLFRGYFLRNSLGTICSALGVRAPSKSSLSYRIPEWFVLAPGRQSLLKPESSYVDEGPDVVLEVRSPGDETDEKTPFYDEVGVRELLIVDRDTLAVELLRRASGRLMAVCPAPDGQVRCEGLRAGFRTVQKDGRHALSVFLELERTEHFV